jgi:hemoglobin-like flavoprotein
LLWTLEKALDPVSTPEVKENWALAYSTLTGVMQAAARSAAA